MGGGRRREVARRAGANDPDRRMMDAMFPFYCDYIINHLTVGPLSLSVPGWICPLFSSRYMAGIFFMPCHDVYISNHMDFLWNNYKNYYSVLYNLFFILNINQHALVQEPTGKKKKDLFYFSVTKHDFWILFSQRTGT